MIRIAVVSDSHGGSFHLERFVEYCKAEGVQQVFHLGDVLDDVRYLERHLDIPIARVAGNCDYLARDAARELLLTFAGKRFLLLHGDRYNVKYGLDALSYYAEEKRADACFFGHTHRPFAGYVGNALLVNPGALKSGSFCLLEVSEGDLIPQILDIDQWWNTKEEKA